MWQAQADHHGPKGQNYQATRADGRRLLWRDFSHFGRSSPAMLHSGIRHVD